MSRINDPDVRWKFIKLVEQGLSNAEVARALNVSRWTVREWKKRLGLTVKSRRTLNKKMLESRFADLYSRGLPYKVIAEKLGVSASTLITWRRRLQLPPRRLIKSSKSRCWFDIPLSIGKSPKEVLKDLSRALKLSKADREAILTYVGKFRERKKPMGINLLIPLLASTFLYLRHPRSGRLPISISKFVDICQLKGYAVSRRGILRWSKILREQSFDRLKFVVTPKDLLKRWWKHLCTTFGLPEDIKSDALQILNSSSTATGRSPAVTVASVIYWVCKKHGVPITQHELADEFGVTEVSIRNFIKQLKNINSRKSLADQSQG